MKQTNEETQNSEIEEGQKLAETVTGALRGHKYGIFEQLICQRLIQATVTTDPLRSVQLITDAALMLDSEMRKSLEIDIEKVSVIKTVCTALSHVAKTRIGNPSATITLVSVEFGLASN
jgi:hypothetical protein